MWVKLVHLSVIPVLFVCTGLLAQSGDGESFGLSSLFEVVSPVDSTFWDALKAACSEDDFERFQELQPNDLFFELMTNDLPSLALQVADMADFQVNPPELTEDGTRLLRPVMLAFAKGYYHVMRKLVEKGAPLIGRHDDNVRLLYILTLDGQWRLLQKLLAEKPDLIKKCVNVRDPSTGRLLFEIALQHKTPDVHLEFLSKLAPTHEKVIGKMSAYSRLMLHLVRGELEAASVYFYEQCVEALYKEECVGWNPLLLAYYHGREDWVALWDDALRREAKT